MILAAAVRFGTSMCELKFINLSDGIDGNETQSV